MLEQIDSIICHPCIARMNGVRWSSTLYIWDWKSNFTDICKKRGVYICMGCEVGEIMLVMCFSSFALIAKPRKMSTNGHSRRPVYLRERIKLSTMHKLYNGLNTYSVHSARQSVQTFANFLSDIYSHFPKWCADHKGSECTN
jgi:hypothetical protein